MSLNLQQSGQLYLEPHNQSHELDGSDGLQMETAVIMLSNRK
jgi:hypothetical protein